MSFLDEAKASIQNRDPRCSVTRFLLTQEDLTDADLRSASAAVSIAAAHRALQLRGFTYRRQTLERHISGSCSCPTS